MRNALKNFKGSITVGGHKISNLRYADDVVLIAGSLDELQDLVDRVKLESGSEKVGLFLNTKKIKVIKFQRNPTDCGNVIYGETAQTIMKFKYLGEPFTNNSDDSTKLKRKICISKDAIAALSKIWKFKYISLVTKR